MERKKYKNVSVDYNGMIYNAKGNALKVYTRKDGYQTVKVCGKTELVHRIVAAAFLGDVTGAEVDHMDGNRANNSVANLQIVSKRENLIRRNKSRNWSVYESITITRENKKLADWADDINAFYA